MKVERNDQDDPRGVEISPGVWHLKTIFPNGTILDSITNTNLKKPCEKPTYLTWGWSERRRQETKLRTKRLRNKK